MAGRGVRAAGAIPPGILGYDSTRAPYPWDTAGARRLLAEAGYAEGLPAPALAQQARRARPDRAVGAAGPRPSLGIQVEIVERDAPSVRATVRNGEADLFLGDWYADYPDPENFSYPLFHSSNKGPGGNYAFLSDTALDAMIVRARSTPDTLEKARLAREIDARVFDLAPWIFLWFPVDVWADAARREGLADSRRLHRPALDRRRSGRPVTPLPPAARLALLRPTLLGVLAVTFLLLYVAPGDPVQAMVGERADAETIARLRAELHLDDPLPLQFVRYVGGVVRGDLGTSYITRRPILGDLLQRFPATLAARRRGDAVRGGDGHRDRRLRRVAAGRLGRPAHHAWRVPGRVVSGLLGGAAADPGVRGDAPLAAAVGRARARSTSSCRRSRWACARSPSCRG